VTLRAFEVADDAFGRALFLERKRAELAGLPEALLESQYAAWRWARAGLDWRCIVDAANAPVGLLVLAWSAAELRVVELVIAAAAQRRGHARAAMAAVLREATGRVSLAVEANGPAHALYRSLGFVEVSAEGSTLQLRRQPKTAS
jgi:ribosomal protein S18 acetylase RimI-like enzyme